MRIAMFAALILCWTAGPASAANGWWTFERNTNLSSTLSWKWLSLSFARKRMAKSSAAPLASVSSIVL